VTIHALQIFRKDIERLWWVVLLTVALLVMFAWQDVNRILYFLPARGTDTGWLNLALPLAWSLLIALVIHQDPLAGDRQFWVSLPCGWQALLAAKSAFLAAFIQLPYFLATAAILLAKGFNPLQHIPHLLWKQVVLLAFILPAVAVAVVVKNITHFLLVVITIAGALIMMSNRFNSGFGTDTSWDVRWELALLILDAGALAVAILQFTTRYTFRARVIAVVAATAAFSVYNWLPRDTSAAMKAAISPAHGAPISLTLGTRVPIPTEQRTYNNFRQTAFLIPIQFSGLGTNSHLDQISFEMTTAMGQHYEAQWAHSSNDVRSQRITAGLDLYTSGLPLFQWLEVGSLDVSKKLLSGPVTIKGRMFARLYQPGQAITLRTSGRTELAGFVYCRFPARDAYMPFAAAECDSPELAADQMLLNGNRFLRNSFITGPSHYPQEPWLSPLHRGIEPFQQRTTFTIAPTTPLGSAVIDYTFPDVDLNRYKVSEVRR